MNAKKEHVKQRDGGRYANQREEKQDQPKKHVCGAQLRDRFLLEMFILCLGEETLGRRFLEELRARKISRCLPGRFSLRPPKAVRDLDQHRDHCDRGDHEVDQDKAYVVDAAEEQITHTDVHVHSGVGDERKLPARDAPNERGTTCARSNRNHRP